MLFLVMNWIHLIKFFSLIFLSLPISLHFPTTLFFLIFFFWLILTNIFHFINSSWYFPFTQITGIGNWCWIWADVARGSQYYPSCINANVTLSSKYFLGSDFLRSGGWFLEDESSGWLWLRSDAMDGGCEGWLSDGIKRKKKIILIYPV